MKSDSEGHVSSESDNQRENLVTAAQKSAAPSSKSDSAVEEESSDKDDVTQRVENLSLSCPGTRVHIAINI